MTTMMLDRDALTEALRARQQELNEMRAEFARLPDLSHFRCAPGALPDSELRRGELISLISGVEAQIESINGKLELLDKSDAYDRSIATADDEIAGAKAELAEAAAESARLQQRRAPVVAKGEQLKAAAAGQLELARTREQSASAAYARAVSEGGEAEQAVAEAEVAAAQAEVAEAVRLADSQSVVLSALDTEVAAIDRLLADVGDRAEDARAVLCAALRLRYKAEWDRAVDRLEQIGACYAETFRMTGGTFMGIAKTSIPRFKPGSATFYLDRLDRAELREVDSRTREHLAMLFDFRGVRVEALRRAPRAAS